MQVLVGELLALVDDVLDVVHELSAVGEVVVAFVDAVEDGVEDSIDARRSEQCADSN